MIYHWINYVIGNFAMVFKISSLLLVNWVLNASFIIIQDNNKQQTIDTNGTKLTGTQ